MNGRHLITALLLLSLSGCGLWTRIDTQNVSYKNDHYQVDLPVDWVRAELRGSLLVTRDGPGVQQVIIEFRKHDEAFEETEQKTSADSLPSELADMYLAELKAQDSNGLPSLEILANRPTTISGQPAFELHLRFLNHDGLRYEQLASGFVTRDGLYLISFQAPTLHYFERDRHAYAEATQTLKSI